MYSAVFRRPVTVAARLVERNRHAGTTGCAVVLAAALLIPAVLAQSAGEYEVKAAFLYNFAKFVEWPALPNGAPFRVCVAGADPFGPTLENALRGRVLDGRWLEVRRPQRLEDASNCQILFIGSMDRLHLDELLGQIRDRPVLTVGEGHQFSQSGGMIAFRIENQRLRFEINREAADRAHLRLSSKLLSLAATVTEGSK